MHTIHYKDGAQDVVGRLPDSNEILARNDRGKYLRAILKGARARAQNGSWHRWSGRDWVAE